MADRRDVVTRRNNKSWTQQMVDKHGKDPRIQVDDKSKER